jgi:hypothetical protein
VTKIKYIDVVYRAGNGARVALNEDTWTYWSVRCADIEDNAFAKGAVLIGLDVEQNPVCLRLSGVVAVQFGEYQKPLIIKVKQKNPLNEDSHYENPLS